MDKKFLLIVDPEATVLSSPSTVHYVLQEIEYKSPNAIEAVDREAALDYCDVILGIKPEYIQ